MAASGLIVLPLRALAQSKERVWHVGFLATRRRPDSIEKDFYGEVPKGLVDLGYVEGRNLVIDWRFADGNYDRLGDLAAELVRIPVDVIVTDGTPGVQAAMKVTKTVPIVFAAAGDPVASGLVKSLARPGGNVTGNSQLLKDISVKQMEALRTILPKLSRLAVIWNPANASSLPNLKSLQAAAPGAKIELLPLEAGTRAEIEKAFAKIAEWHGQALLWIVDSTLIQELRLIADLCTKNHLPSVGGLGEYPEAGGLLSYGIRRASLYRRTATYIDKIFKGANPGDLPVEQPTSVDVVINRRTAKALGLTVPPELLLLADKVIE
jgi:putative ABC transport system substrate-binding protein